MNFGSAGATTAANSAQPSDQIESAPTLSAPSHPSISSLGSAVSVPPSASVSQLLAGPSISMGLPTTQSQVPAGSLQYLLNQYNPSLYMTPAANNASSGLTDSTSLLSYLYSPYSALNPSHQTFIQQQQLSSASAQFQQQQFHQHQQQFQQQQLLAALSQQGHALPSIPNALSAKDPGFSHVFSSMQASAAVGPAIAPASALKSPATASSPSELSENCQSPAVASKKFESDTSSTAVGCDPTPSPANPALPPLASSLSPPTVSKGGPNAGGTPSDAIVSYNNVTIATGPAKDNGSESNNNNNNAGANTATSNGNANESVSSSVASNNEALRSILDSMAVQTNPLNPLLYQRMSSQSFQGVMPDLNQFQLSMAASAGQPQLMVPQDMAMGSQLQQSTMNVGVGMPSSNPAFLAALSAQMARAAASSRMPNPAFGGYFGSNTHAALMNAMASNPASLQLADMRSLLMPSAGPGMMNVAMASSPCLPMIQGLSGMPMVGVPSNFDASVTSGSAVPASSSSTQTSKRKTDSDKPASSSDTMSSASPKRTKTNPDHRTPPFAGPGPSAKQVASEETHAPHESIIECGVVQVGPDGNPVRVRSLFSSFFGKEVEVYTAISDPQRRLLFQTTDVARLLNVSNNMLAMYLARRKYLRNSGIFQATDIMYKENSRKDIRSGAYFISLEACQDFEQHLKRRKSTT